VFGYAVDDRPDGFPAPVIHVAADGTFSGRSTIDPFKVTVIKGRIDRRRGTATGTILLAPLSTPSNPLSVVSATFSARRTRS
jgi:hypothetical protein